MAFLPSVSLGATVFNGINKPGNYVWTGSPVGLPHTFRIVPNSTPAKTYAAIEREWFEAGPIVNGLPTSPYKTTVKVVISSNNPLVNPTTVADVVMQSATFCNAANLARVFRNEN